MLIGVGIPIFNSVPGEGLGPLMKAAVEISKHGNVKFITPVDVVPYHAARNEIIALADDVDLLLFIDSDTLVPPGFFDKMLKELDNGYVVVNAHSYRRGFPYTCIWSKRLPAKGSRVAIDALRGVHEIDSGGFGLTLINWNWCKKFMPEFRFQCLPSGAGEDGAFYNAVKFAGGKIAGHADVRCGHISNKVIVDDSNVKFLLLKDLGYGKKNGFFPESGMGVSHGTSDNGDRLHEGSNP
jgi:hypothetical protein